MVTKHHLKELGHEVTLVNHVDSQFAKAWASKRRLGEMKTCNVEVHVRARCCGEEANDTCQCQHQFEQGRLDDKVSYVWNAHERLRNVGTKTPQRRRKIRLKQSQ